MPTRAPLPIPQFQMFRKKAKKPKSRPASAAPPPSQAAAEAPSAAPAPPSTDAVFALAKGDPVWVAVSADMWEAGVLAAGPVAGAKALSVSLPGADAALYPTSSVFPANHAAGETAADVIALSHLNEPAVLHGLRLRHAADDVYTRCGPVLVAVNPFKDVPSLYDAATAARYAPAALAGAKEDSTPPHIYETAARAYAALAAKGVGQSLVISGESGAGKTETAKLAMRHLASLAGGTGVEAAVLASNPLLEAFGNAKTARNDNSSRFGKLVSVRFDGARRVAGARVQTFLLEKSRLVARPVGERSFHVLYALTRGADADTRTACRLPADPAAFAYLAGDGSTIPGVDDAAAFGDMVEALEAVGVGADDRDALWRVVAGCLWLGNIQFADANGGEASEAVEDGALASASHLLGVDPSALSSALTTRAIDAGGDVVLARLRPAAAAAARDALAKAVYACLFDWLVERVNEALAGGDAEAADAADAADGDDAATPPELSILDIYGFECFGANGFEQLAINYANEHLQHQFNAVMLALEQDEYKTEGVDWARVAWRDNAPALAALDARPPAGVGVLALLDEACVVPGGSDSGFGLRVAAALASSPAVGGCPAGAGATFSVDHAAGVVTYTTVGFLDRNKDVVQPAAAALLAASADALPRALASAAATLAARRGATVMGSFRDQLRSLLGRLGSTELHFVRCVKPNAAQAPAAFDAPLVAHQLRCAGVTEVARIARAGYPTRLPYADVAARFGLLLGGGGVDAASPKSACLSLLSLLRVPADAWAAGVTKLFLRAGVLSSLELALARAHAAASVLGARWRGRTARRSFLATRSAIVAIQAAERGRTARALLVRAREAACVIQAAARRRALTRRVAARVAAREACEREEAAAAAAAEAAAVAEHEAAAATAAREVAALADASAAAEASLAAAADARRADAGRKATAERAAATAVAARFFGAPGSGDGGLLAPPRTASLVQDPGDGWRVTTPAGLAVTGAAVAAPAARGAPAAPRRPAFIGAAANAPVSVPAEVALWAAYAERLEVRWGSEEGRRGGSDHDHPQPHPPPPPTPPGPSRAAHRQQPVPARRAGRGAVRPGGGRRAAAERRARPRARPARAPFGAHVRRRPRPLLASHQRPRLGTGAQGQPVCGRRRIFGRGGDGRGRRARDAGGR